jgi:hypothetical protein
MSDSLFSLSSLAIVTPVVALATYAIVLNLDRIIQVFIPLTSATSTPSKPPIQNLRNAQIRRMQQDRSTRWKERGEAFEKYKLLGKSGRRPSQWRILQYMLRGVFLPIWDALAMLFSFFIHPFMSCRKLRRRKRDDGSTPASACNLEDVEVQVQVDVSVEKG